MSRINRISPSSSANEVSVSIDGVAGGKVTARDRAASFASEGGAASLSLFFIDGVAGGKDTVRGRAASFASEGDGIAVPISF